MSSSGPYWIPPAGVTRGMVRQQTKPEPPGYISTNEIFHVAMYLDDPAWIIRGNEVHYAETYDFSILVEQEHLRKLFIRLIKHTRECEEMRLYDLQVKPSTFERAQARREAWVAAHKEYNERYDEYTLVARLIAPNVRYLQVAKRSW